MDLSFREYKWCTRMGEVIMLKDMSTKHIENTIRMLDTKRTTHSSEWADNFRKELAYRSIKRKGNLPSWF